MIIGLTGTYCSGKDTVADYLVKQCGFAHFSLSDIIREEMKKAGVETTRENLIVFGTDLRKNNGNGILAKKALEKTLEDKNYCITSIRHPDEINEFKKRKDFILVNIDAPREMRFERMKKRNRAGDPETFEKFVELEAKESQSDGSGQQLSKCASMADIVFINDVNNIETLNLKIDNLLKQLSERINRNDGHL